MKYIAIIILIHLLNSCSNDSFYTEIGKQTIKDGSEIKLLLHGGGATDTDIIWVSKESTDNKKYIAKIKWNLGGYTSKI